jgi:hypothetical protein
VIAASLYDQFPHTPGLAFIYTDAHGPVALNDLIDPASGWDLKAAFGINDSGEVVGYGYHNGSDNNHARAFKLTLPDLSPCPPPTDACRTTPGVKNLLTGICSYPPKANGTACDDGNACTQGDACQAGVCQGPNTVTCAAPDQCHDAGTCNPSSPAPGPPAPQDLIGWWKLDGNGNDEVGDHDLTIEGGVTAAPGRVGMGMKFDGTGCMTTTDVWTDSRLEDAPGVTMMAWVRGSDTFTCPAEPQPNDPKVVMGKGLDYTSAAWCMGPGIPGLTGTASPDGATSGYPSGWGQLSPDRWDLLTVTWDHQTLRLYNNGKFGISLPLEGGDFQDVGLFAIGCMVRWFDVGTRTGHFIGTIDEAMLYQRALSDADIAAYYAASDPCVYPPKANGTTCSDGNGCTLADTCQTGACVSGAPLVCTAQDQCHTAGTCAPATGTCSNPAVADGTTCSDNNVCTLNDTCQAGACTAGSASPACSLPPGLTGPQLDAARAAGLLPGYPTLRTLDPRGTAPDNVATVALAINNSGLVAGYTHNNLADYPQGQMAYPLLDDSQGGHQLPTPSQWTAPNAPAYAVDVNDAGLVVGQGGPGIVSGSYRWQRPIVFHGYDSTELPWVPTTPGMQVFSVNNTLGSWNLPTIAGEAISYNWETPATGTLAVWHFDANADDAFGISNFPATGLTWTDDHTSTRPDGAVVMDGATCLQTTAMAPTGEHQNAVNYTSAGMTFLAWVRPDSTMCSGANLRFVAARGNDFILWMDCNTDGTARVGASATFTTGAQTITPVGSIPLDGTWRHVAVTWDKARAQTFVDGVRVGDQAFAGTINHPTASSVSVGCLPGMPATNFIGAIDEVSMFQNAMGADEIGLHFRNLPNYNKHPIVSSQWARIQDGMFNVITPPAGQPYLGSGQAFRVNDAGIVLGYQTLTGGTQTAMMFIPTEGWKNLNQMLAEVVPDNDWDLQVARDVDPTGRFVVGDGMYYGRHMPFRFDTQTREVVPLGRFEEFPFTLNGFEDWVIARARSINADGHIVGVIGSLTWFYDRAFIYTDATGIVDLNEFVVPETNGWVLRDALSINDNDEIAGWASHGDPLGAPSQMSFRGFKLAMPELPSREQVACIGQADGTSCSTGAQSACGGHEVCLAGVCGGSAPAVCLRVDAIVDTGDGKYTALFGFDNLSSSSVHPTTNQALRDGAVMANPQPLPPALFPTGTHIGAYKPTFTSAQTVGWRVDGQLVTAGIGQPGSPTPTTCQYNDKGDCGIWVGGAPPPGGSGTWVTIKPNLNQYSQPPTQEPTAQQPPPVGEAFNGVLAGQFSVSPSGAATYTLPISIPPGIAGMAPNLALVYNSQGGNGIAGPGWSLSGLSMISRCPRTRQQDGYARPVMMDSLTGAETDGICLDGEKLFEEPAGSGNYLSERTDFSTITRESTWFKVLTMAG